MKKVEAIIKAFKFEEVRDALSKIGITGMTVSDVTNFRRHWKGDSTGQYLPIPGSELKLEVVVPEESFRAVTNAIAASAGTGRLGDGNIFISQIEEAVRIRTFEKDQMAVC